MPIEITMPRMSDTMEAGTIIKWNVTEGDAVSAGDVIADVETDKATMEMQAYDDGTMAAITVPEGQMTDVGAVIAVLAEEDEDVASVRDAAHSGTTTATAPTSDEQASATPTDEAAAEPTAPGATSPAPTRDGRLRVSPVARRLADEHGLDLRTIQGSGPSGRIVKNDILKAVASGAETVASVPPSAALAPSAPAPTSIATPVSAVTNVESRIVPLSGMRQTIARRLVESKTTIPHYQVSYTFAMDELIELRRTLNEQLAGQGIKLSVNDFIVRACALAMHQHPEFNASFGGDSIHYHGEVNVGIAISLPAERGGGLVVATIRHADQKGLRTISAESKALAEKARDRGLAPDDMADSTFTVSNLGMFGVDNFTAIINPPNSAILAVGAAIQKPVVRDGELAVGWEMSGTLSNDHRVIDGAMAARYLATLREMIEQPAALLV